MTFTTRVVVDRRSGDFLERASAAGTSPNGERVRDVASLSIAIVEGPVVLPRVVAAPTKAPEEGLAFTGPAAIVPLTVLATLLLALGAAVLWLASERRRDEASELG
jgi:hypothetical protein